MSFLIEPKELARRMALEPKPVLLDARFRLAEPSAAEQLFLEGHIPGAQRVDLGKDLSGPKSGSNGRHPLPSREALVQLFSRLGIDSESEVVAYDDTDHAGAGRLWFLLRWMGHDKVKVLHGGLKAWGQMYPLEIGPAVAQAPRGFVEKLPLVATKDWKEASLLVDARAPERYRGEVEPLDPKAGHIPGAKNLPYSSILVDGKFPSPAVLKEKLEALGEGPTFYCGSGVTATVLLLAAEIAGLPASIYPGSWSEYCAIPGAEIEKG